VFISGKIAVTHNKKYIIPYFSSITDNDVGSFYDENDQWASGVTGVRNGDYRIITVPDNTKIAYMKINHIMTGKSNLMVVEGENYPTEYIPFHKKLEEDISLNDTQKVEVEEILNTTVLINNNLVASEIIGTTQSVILSADGWVQRVEHRNALGENVRTDTYTHSPNRITEIRTLNSGESITLIYHLDTMETEVI